MNIIYLITSLFAGCYFIFFLNLYYGWRKLISKQPNKKLEENIKLSLIIPFHSQKERIEEISKCLDLDSDMEIIFVNDGVEDTSSVEKPNRQIHVIPNSFSKGKKNAIQSGIQKAKGNWIIQSDIDCLYNADWLINVKQAICTNEADFLILPVLPDFPRNNFLQRIFALEFFSMMATGLSYAALKNPFISNGAAMAYKKIIFESMLKEESEKKKYFKHPSGDDVFLLHFAKGKKYKIIALPERNVSVTTDMPVSIKKFIAQRVRWASKSKSYKDMLIILLSLLILFYNSFLIVLLIASPFLSGFFILAFGLWLLKFVVDYVFLSFSLSYYKIKIKRIEYFILALIYPLYIIFASLEAFIGKFSWNAN